MPQTRRSSARTLSCSNWDDECWRQWCVSGTQRDVTYWTRLQPTTALIKIELYVHFLQHTNVIY